MPVNTFMKIAEILGITLAEAGAGIGHMVSYMKQGPFIAMSAWRGHLSRGTKRHREAELRHRLFTDYGLSSIRQKGFWPEEHDNKGAVTQTGNEDSILVPMNQPDSRIHNVDEFYHLANQLMIDYDQDAVMFNDGKETHMLFHPQRPDPKFGLAMLMGSKLNVLVHSRPIS